MATNAFTLDWVNLKAYANPPCSIIGRVLAQTQQQRADLVLVTPVWKTQSWYPALLDIDMCRDFPRLILASHNPLSTPEVTPQLAVWSISGDSTKSKSFQRKLMLASWREKSSRTYQSQFMKWISWCGTRSVDPPIGEVVNFLADLFDQGYQYSHTMIKSMVAMWDNIQLSLGF